MVKVTAGTATNVKIATDVKNAITTSTATTTDSGNIPDFKSSYQRKFWHVCHQYGVVGDIRPKHFTLLREKN